MSCIKQYEIDLRGVQPFDLVSTPKCQANRFLTTLLSTGNKIGAIENLGASEVNMLFHHQHYVVQH
jgi:hypothetical protein